jgi:hypothetical protein
MAESREEKKGLWLKLRRWPGLVLAALITATVGFLVNEFGPAVVELLRGDPALRFVVRENIDPYEDAGPAVALAEPLPEGRFPSPSTCADAIGWLKSQGGVDAARTYLSISIEGMNDVPVLIQSMRARIEARQPPIRHTTAECETAGVVELTRIGFDLDEPSPVAREFRDDGSLGGPFFEARNITIAEGEVLPMSITAFAERCYCRWRIEVDAVVEGEPQTFVLDQNGRPFGTTGMVLVPSERVSFFDGQWARCRGDQECDASGGPTPTPLPERRIRELERLGTLPVPP